jgi:hypothetical protein
MGESSLSRRLKSSKVISFSPSSEKEKLKPNHS